MRKNIKRNTKGQFSKNTSEVSFVNLSTYTSPEIIEVKSKKWVEYGADNNYFQFLIDRYNGSPTNNAAINGISQSIYGKGLNATDAARKPDQYAQMISMFKKDVIKKVCYDYYLMGQAAIQVIYSKDRSKIALLEHIPIETLRAEKANEDGDIPAYYYFKNWADIKPSDEPLRIPAYGMSNENIEIYYIKPYKAGFYYYSPVAYQGGLQYAELEEEISNYHLNNILNGLSPSMLISFNNGVPNQEERRLIESKIAQKFSGTSNAGKFILSFNDNKEQESTITPVQLSDAHNQYQFLSDESSKKIMVSHRIVSPMLLGIKDSTGLGNNADEIKTASLLMDNTVIRPYQELLIDCFDVLLGYNNIALNLYFITLQPLEFTEVDPTLQDSEDIEEETGIEMSKVKLKPYDFDKCLEEQKAIYGKDIAPKICGWLKSNTNEFNLKQIDGKPAFNSKEKALKIAEIIGCVGYHEHEEDGKVWYMPCKNHNEFEKPKLTQELGDGILNSLEGGKMSKEWEIVDKREYDKDNFDIDYWANLLIKPKKSTLSKIKKLIGLKDEIYSDPNGFSILDKSFYKVRYRYFKKSNKRLKTGKSRDFCENMMRLAREKVVYRLEDIDRASRDGVNRVLGHKGRAYDLFKFKGGIYCRHAWEEVLYRLKANTEKSEYLDDYKKVGINGIPKSYRPRPFGSKQAKEAPVNMPNQGAYPK